jgi:uncharacterized protein (DUF305 family)
MRPTCSLVLVALIRSAVLLSSMAAAGDLGPLAEPERSFLTASQASMLKMMVGMAREPLGDVDQDFIGQMIPHHQGAIDMAKAELRYGQNEQLRRIAQEIIVEQQAEIAVMQQERISHSAGVARAGVK